MDLAERTVALIAELEPELRERLNEAATDALIGEDGMLVKISQMLNGKKGWGKDAEKVAQTAAATLGWMSRFSEAKIVKSGHSQEFLKVCTTPFLFVHSCLHIRVMRQFNIWISHTHSHKHTNKQVFEPAFSHKSAAVRQASFKSWFHLACVFDGMSSTLAHPKRLELICRPFRTSWPNDKSIEVRRTAVTVWSHIVNLLTRRCTIEKTSAFEVAVASVLSAVLGEADRQIRAHLIHIVGGLLYGKTDASSTTGNLLPLEHAPATNLSLRLDFLKTRSLVLFDLLLQLGLSDNEEERTQVTQVWIGFVARLAIEEDGRDTVEALSRAVVHYWADCLLCNTTNDDGHERKAVVLRVLTQVCSHSSASRLLFCTSTSLNYTAAGDGAFPAVKLAPYLAGAVSIASQEEPEHGAQILAKIFALFPNDPRSFRQLFDVVEHVASSQGLVRDASMPIRFWMNACMAYTTSLEVSRHVLASPGQAKMQAPVLTLVLAQVPRLPEGLDADYSKEIEKHWSVLYDQLREVTKSKNNSHCLAAAVRVCTAICKNSAGSLESVAANGIRHLDFVLGTMLDEANLDTASSKSKGSDARHALQSPSDHPLQSISEVWAMTFRCAYRAFEEKRVALPLLKSVISRLLPILDHTLAADVQHQGPLSVLMAPMSKCLGACSRQGNDNTGMPQLGRAGAEGILDEVQSAWDKMVDTLLKSASHEDLGTLSPLLVAALSNSNSKIQNRAVECWNENFGDGAEKSQLPATLQYCLKKLSKRVHINMQQNADDSKVCGSPADKDESQIAFSQGSLLLKSPARLISTHLQGNGSLLSNSKRAGSRPGSVHNTPARSPAKTKLLLSSSEKTEVKSEALMSEDARDVDYVQIANAKRKLHLTEHQREVRKAACMGSGMSYTSLEDPESRMVGAEGEMLLIPSDSRTQWSDSNFEKMNSPTHDAPVV